MLKVLRGCTVATRKCPYHNYGLGVKARNPEYLKRKRGNEPYIYTREMPPCCIKHCRELIWYTIDLLEEEGITYWADFGTLLGAVREGRTVPHDTDADLCAFVEDRPKILDLKDRVQKDGFAMGIKRPIRPGDDHIKICRSGKNHMTLDIFFWRHDNHKNIYKSPGLNAPKSFPDWWVEELTRVEIFGKKMWAPRDPEHFLQMRFGSAWKKPKDEKVHDSDAIRSHVYGFTYADKRGWKKKVKLT